MILDGDGPHDASVGDTAKDDSAPMLFPQVGRREDFGAV
jgi:hypothetical protein